jgi:hypothetical protein
MARSRPFISGNEPPRPFSEAVLERSGPDPLERVLGDIARLEGEAAAAECGSERARLQCEAEALRCALHERPRRRT